jgi:hypothetical protein
MSSRGFPITTVTGTAQPAFGTTLSAALVVLTKDFSTQRVDPASNPSQASVTVVNPFLVRKGDRVAIGTLANFGFGPTVTQSPDWGNVTAVNYGTGVVTVKGLLRTHAVGEFMVLSVACAEFNILGSGISTSLYIGEDSTVGIASNTLLSIIGSGLAYSFGQSSSGNVWDTGHIWVQGTAADTFLPSFWTI